MILNGIDELNCKIEYELAYPHYLCDKDEFYCVSNKKNDNSIVCYNYTLAGDGRNDCLGNIDERVNDYCRQNNPFQKEH
ncbi:unnamed protein product [Didymodactylos carnosus]|uniref:Uncharacterized protein n=1 Tax=Didymodactylos carnosus TaxID=1234261 RepID=A0A814XM29_9BILA|nr:unnamed protein product [Didymodactylos carnosus]CAF1287089.1 unnamed protein product [Didymodactylos carnosus]CAF3981357.1 unnamed protein product [Didymodactylos carnosus]CAF4092142.1 unnamed protein product [Didymodactylos carnosus]